MQISTYVVNNHSYKVYLRDEADQSVAAEIFKLHEYRIAEPHLRQITETIVDGGAHSGLFTLYARALNPTAPIVAVEPEENNLKLLKKHLVDNSIDGIEVVAGALAEDYGKKKLILSADSHNHHLARGGETKESITVQGLDFKHLMKHCQGAIGLLKMDIEGGEYDFLGSLADEDFKKIKAIIMEYHDVPGLKHASLEQLLREHGFGVQIFPSKFDKTMGFMWAVNKRTR